MAVSMSSRPSGSAEAAPPSVTPRRSPRFDPYKASSAQRAQQRATPRSLETTVDPSPFAVVTPTLVPKRTRKSSTTASTSTSADRTPRTSKATRGAPSSLKENEAKSFRQTSAFAVKSTLIASTMPGLDEPEAAGISPIKTRSTRRSAAVVSREQIESAPALRRLLKKGSQPATTTQDEVLPRAIIKSVKAKKQQPCPAKEKGAAAAQESTTVNGRFLRPRHRVAGAVIAQTCKTTAASLYKSIITTILPSSTSKSRRCRTTVVAKTVLPTTLATSGMQKPLSSSAQIAPSNDYVDSVTLSISDLPSTAPLDQSQNSSTTVRSITPTPSPPVPSTLPLSIPETPLPTHHSHNPATSYPNLPEASRATPHPDSTTTAHSEGSEPLSPYLDVVAVPGNPLPSYPAPSTYDTVDMGSMPASDAPSPPPSPIGNGTSDFRLPASFIESTYSTLTYALTPVPQSPPPSILPVSNGDAACVVRVDDAPACAPLVPYIPPAPHFGQTLDDAYTSYSPAASSFPSFAPSFPSSCPSPSSVASAQDNTVGCHHPPNAAQAEGLLQDVAMQSVEFVGLGVASNNGVSGALLMQAGLSDAMDVSADDQAPASESDLGFGFAPQDHVQVQTIQLPEVSFVVPAATISPSSTTSSSSTTTDEYAVASSSTPPPTLWPRHAKLSVEWSVFAKSQRWHEYLAQMHAQLLVVPHPGLRKEGNLKRVCAPPEPKPMQEVGQLMDDRSLFVSMSRGRVLEICRRMGAETIRDIVADEAWRFFKKMGVFPSNFARSCMRNPMPSQSQHHPESAPVQPSDASKADAKGDEEVEESIIDFMSEEIYDFELEDEDAMEEDAVEEDEEDVRVDPRLPARFCVYLPEEDDDGDDEPAEVADAPVGSNDVLDDDETDNDSSCSDDSEEDEDDDDMELVASTDSTQPAPDATGGCSFMQLDLQLPAQEPTSPSSLAPHEDLFHVPIAHQVNFDQSAWEDARQLHGILQTVQDASRQGVANPPPPRAINVGTLKIPLSIPSFASIRLRCLSASDSYSYGQLPLRGTKADKVINYAWHLSPPLVETADFAEHHARTGSVAVRPPRVYRHAIIKPPEVIRSFLKVAVGEVAQVSQSRKRVREQHDQDADDLERSRPRLRLDSGVADQHQQVASTSPEPSSTCVSPGQGSAMAWMPMEEAQPQTSLDSSFQYQSAVMEAAYTQVTDMFQPDGAWYYGMPPAASNDFPPVHHAPPQLFASSTSSSLSNALGQA